MLPIEAVGDPVRRRMVELLAGGERPAGQIAEAVSVEFGISQPATSRHLRVLRDARLVRCRVDGARRLYMVDPAGLDEIDAWLRRLHGLWSTALDALETEIARGHRKGNDDHHRADQQRHPLRRDQR